MSDVMAANPQHYSMGGFSYGTLCNATASPVPPSQMGVCELFNHCAGGNQAALGLKSGDKILFLQKQNGEIVISNASAATSRKAQAAFAGASEALGVSSEDDIQALVDEVRYGKGQ